MKLVKLVIESREDHVLTILRVVTGLVILGHGMQKLMGWFGGHGVEWTITMWQQWFGFPPFITVLVILGETIGALSLVIGFVGRIMAGVQFMIMTGAIYFVHARWGFFMNWYAEQRGEGFEYHILMIAMLTAVLWKGSGAFSVDRLILQRIH